MPTMRSVMTPFPQTVGPEERAGAAGALMAAHRIHHLPVLGPAGLVGLVTSASLRDAPADRPVGELALAAAVEVDVGAPLDRVLEELAARHLDAAVVLKEERLAGIFTLGDACRRFAALLREVFPGGPRGDSAA
jgi:CBS domain-containing protein